MTLPIKAKLNEHIKIGAFVRKLEVFLDFSYMYISLELSFPKMQHAMYRI